MLFISVLQVIDSDEDGLQNADLIGLLSSECQKKSIVDENGVNWDVFLDGYLCDGFTESMIDEAEQHELPKE